ncbi:hypothetical protein V1517DRAFT_326166 [Lipomyces orientalis]|uniref:Uncharacterized protein n=1 Tax=Lipomyces orientalis TaxID=1233043 RepID=A0ACC3TK59_9ASCO
MSSPTNTAASRVHGRIQLCEDIGSRPSNSLKRPADSLGPSSESSTSNHHQRRRRTVLACDVCRSRRTRCDGRRPRCSSCLQHDSPCIYRPAAAPAPSKLEVEISTIRESLDHITHLLSYRAEKLHAVASPVLEAVAEDVPPEQEPAADFPFMTLRTRSMMTIIGVEKGLADFLVNMERADISRLAPAKGSGFLVLQYQRAVNALAAFSERIHTWYPILHPGFSDQFFQAIAGSFHNSTDSCLVLLVAAIGSLAESDSVMAALEARPDAPYIESALSMLPTVLVECSLRSLQCLVLFSVYYCCLVKPCQAHDYALMASFKAQNILKSQLYVDNAEKLELVRRAFWATLLIESELSVQFDLAESGIWKLDSHIPLPDSHETWNIATTASPVVPTSPESVNSAGTSSDEMRSYFLAEIAMRRMLHRCTISISTTSNGHFIYAPIIAAELELQLEQWHAVLPEHLRFGQPDLDDRIESATAGFLQAQYYSCKASIYWPAVYQAIESSEADSDLLPHCHKFFDSYVNFMVSATSTVQHCLPNLWTLYASIFIISMAALKAANTPCLRSTMPSRVAQCFELANEAFQVIGGVSPSLTALQEILNERVSTRHRG